MPNKSPDIHQCRLGLICAQLQRNFIDILKFHGIDKDCIHLDSIIKMMAPQLRNAIIRQRFKDLCKKDLSHDGAMCVIEKEFETLSKNTLDLIVRGER